MVGRVELMIFDNAIMYDIHHIVHDSQLERYNTRYHLRDRAISVWLLSQHTKDVIHHLTESVVYLFERMAVSLVRVHNDPFGILG